MVLTAARELVDGETCFVGIGLPSLAAVVAKLTHAPGLTLMYESGIVDTIPPIPPLSTGSPCVIDDAAYVGDCLLAFGALQAGHLNIGILSAAQIDRRGNLNSTVIGDYGKPKLRMVGSGGAHDIASLIDRVLILMPHEPRRFVERVDFITSPGHPARNGRLQNLADRGPVAVVTPRARFVFEDGDMILDALQPGFGIAEAIEGFGWKPRLKTEVAQLATPDPAALAALRGWLEPSVTPI